MMQEHNLKLISGPLLEPVTVAEVKMHAHIDHDVEDALIAAWIKAAREEAEDFQRRSYYTQTWELSFDKFPLLPVALPRPPLLEVLSINYTDYNDNEVECDLADFTIDTDSEPGRVAHGYGLSWPSTTLRDIAAVRIRYKAGYADGGTTTTSAPDFVIDAIPESVKNAIILYCTWHNENRAAETAFPPHFYNLLRKDRVFA